VCQRAATAVKKFAEVIEVVDFDQYDADECRYHRQE
jgi:hypothetical protein